MIEPCIPGSPFTAGSFPPLLCSGGRHTCNVKNVLPFTVGALLLGPLVFPAQAAFTSLYVFGDGVSTTTNNPLAGTNYYGLRRSNGRVWVEVLAQRQGLGANSITNVNWSYSTNNWSYFGQYSSNLVVNLTNFPVPSDANTALFVVWVNNADFVDHMGSIFPSTNIVTWTNAINQSLNNHFKAITNLYYAKGARTLIMPNAVDITQIPQYNLITSSADKSFIRQRIIDFNAAFATTLINQIQTNCPNITIYVPDMFTLLNNILAHAADYGLTNALYLGQSIAALEDPLLRNKSTNGPGTNYIFWTTSDPTAKLHARVADVVQQLISPVQISKITSLNSSNRLDLANIPIGRNGFVEGSTNFTSWTTLANITSTNATQPAFVPASDPLQFYRLRFPFAWTWP
ncbi:MAG: SGNH/GDSL hydrolase family protein [Verrucomicrobia bacterium]|nr:SGNH/GDSL hydrolase family protein [Verrucomicrobiota bacterium]